MFAKANNVCFAKFDREIGIGRRHGATRLARELLATLTKTLNTARAHLAQERRRLAIQQSEFSPQDHRYQRINKKKR